MSYNKELGEASLVGESQPTDAPKPATSTIEGDAFNAYMRRLDTPVILPSPVEPDFCKRMQEFITTRGQGMASPEQIMQAYELFQDKCVEKPKDKPVEEDSPPPVKENVSEEKSKDEGVGRIDLGSVVPSSFVPLSVSNLGQSPSAFQSGEVSENATKDEKKGANWLIYLLIGGALLYLVTRKKN
jgi:hypothetical protein